MTTRLQTAIMRVAIAALTLSTTNGQPLAAGISFRVAKGDTYINLFGPDWEKAYQQNKVTVMRAGHPISSADILVEDSIVTVTGDVELTPRAWSRVQTLRQRYANLQARLAVLEPKLTDELGARQAADYQRLLASSPRFAADVEFAEQEIEHLDRLTRKSSGSVPVQPPTSVWWIVAVAATILALAGVIFWRRQRAVYPEGSARYREALKDVQAAFQHAGVER